MSLEIREIDPDRWNNEQYMSINQRKKRVKGEFKIFKIVEGEFIIMYIPAYNMTAYGKNDQEAFEMLEESLDDYFDALIYLKKDDIIKELSKYGWKQSLFSKQFHNKAYIDKNGVLKNLDLPEDTQIEESKVEFA